MRKVLFVLSILLVTATVYGEEFTIVTMNAWPGIEQGGFIFVNEVETEEVRDFRQETLINGLERLQSDIIVLNGLNPAETLADEVASKCGMSANTRISRSGLRIGPISFPLNLRIGDAIMMKEDFLPEATGRKFLGSGFSGRQFSLFSRKGAQVIGSRFTFKGQELYIFTAEWESSIFSDRESLDYLMESYLNGDIAPELYPETVGNAVSGAELRLRQAKETLAFINNTAGEAPVILCGSLNALSDSKEIDVLLDAGFSDVWSDTGKGEGNTIDPRVNTNIKKNNDLFPTKANRIDYILIRGQNLNAVSAEIVLNKAVYGVFPSDRFGVKAVLRLSEPLSGQ